MECKIPASMLSYIEGSIANIQSWIELKEGVSRDDANKAIGEWLLSLARNYGTFAVSTNSIKVALDVLPNVKSNKAVTIKEFATTLIEMAEEKP